MTKVLIDDDGTGNQAFVDSPAPALLTGTEAAQGNFFRGDEDPAETPAYLAILEPGDMWVDTAFGPPFSTKVRNPGNTAWTVAGLTVYDALGNLAATVEVDEGGLSISTSEAGVQRTVIRADSGGRVQIDANDAAGAPVVVLALNLNDTATVDISAAGGVEINSSGPATLGGEPIGTQAAAVADVVDPMDPESVAATLDALLAAMRASDLLAP